MTKEEKVIFVQELTERLKSNPNIYVTDAGGLTVAQVSKLRGLCYDAGVSMRIVKNTLLRKAMEASEGNYEGIFDTLKQQSSVFFINGENVNAPGKILKEFRKTNTKPVLKSAWIDEAIFIGDDSLDALASLKSKNELIGEIVGLLQSPIQKVIGQIKSGGNTLAGLVKTLSEREG